jgi:two-component system sensor histidine kinase QseC
MSASERPKSLKRRLILILLALGPVVWLSAMLGAYYVARQESNELFDTQQALFARQLLTAVGDDEDFAAAKGGNRKLLPHDFSQLVLGVDLEPHALGFAVRANNGRLLLADGEGELFPRAGQQQGFVNVKLKSGRHWRIFFLNAPDGSYNVAVGQSIAFRNRFALGLAATQLLPWLAALPVWLLMMVVAVGKGLAPLNMLADSVRRRRADDRTPITTRVPSEILPLTQALNALFKRVADTLEHERRFTADAAHELRTPLAALKIQAEVLALVEDDGARQHALKQLMNGIDRAHRLIEQMLALSRLDPLTGPAQREPIAWHALAEQARDDVLPLAMQRAAQIEIIGAEGPALNGDPMLLALLLRNLLDNALRYSPPEASIQLQLSPQAVAVCDNGPGIPEEELARVRERFYRPPGQEMAGSGLGLSIVERVAALHGLRLELANRPEGGLSAILVPLS